MKFGNFINEKEEIEKKEDEAENGNSQKILHLAKLLDQKENLAKMKKGVAKALNGKPLSDSERVILKDILSRIFRPNTATFLRLMKKF